MQTRYFCPECRRQFAKPESVLQPFDGVHCPACGGQYLKAVEYSPAMPGDDYDPTAPDVPRVPTPVLAVVNHTLQLSETEP